MGNIVLIGVGGIGISSLAYIFKKLGYSNIIGIDKEQSQITNQLDKDGIKIILGHGNYQVCFDDFVVYSDGAINSLEVIKSLEYTKNPKSNIFHYAFSYHEFMGEISKYFKTICVAGTHGKSTTTAMCINVLSQITHKFALGVVGALIPQFNNKNFFINEKIIPELKSIFDHLISGKFKYLNHKLIKQFYFIAEADEFNKHFLFYDPDYSIITNMELDHSDVYKDYEEYIIAFQEFYKKTRYKIFILNSLSEKQFLDDFQNKFKNINLKKFNFRYIFGHHNEINASLVHGLIKTIFPKIHSNDILNILNNFRGLRRRQELLGETKKGTIIYSDYGHHPSELEVVYNAIKSQYPNKRLIAIFQPHQARRVLEFFDKFIHILKKFDENYIYNIYTAREKLVDLKKIFVNKNFGKIDNIIELGNLFADYTGGQYIEDFESILNKIESKTDSDLIICFSAGDLDFKLRNYL